jgi:hypothetical protein
MIIEIIFQLTGPALMAVNDAASFSRYINTPYPENAALLRP